MFFVNIVLLIAMNEYIQLLNCCYDDLIFMRIAFFIPVFQLALEDPCRDVAVCGAFIEAVILLHRLVVQVFAVNDKQYLVNIGQGGSQLGSLEARQGLAGTSCVPDVAPLLPSFPFSCSWLISLCGIKCALLPRFGMGA